MREEFKRLKRWVEECPIEAAMRIEELEAKLDEVTTLYNGSMKAIRHLTLENGKYEESLREIDTHIRSTPEPVSHIIGTLKKTLPEYND